MDELFPGLASTPEESRTATRHFEPVFKPYHQHQQLMFPQDLSEWIAENHLVRVVDQVVDQMDLSSVRAVYKGGGTTAYAPEMLLKVLVYAFVSRVYSSRRIAKLLREDIHAIWLSGHQQPDFRTINLFRSSRLKEVIGDVFGTVLSLLVKEGYVDLSHYFVDGTTMEANANKHTAVWRKNTERYIGITTEQITKLFEMIERENAIEQSEYGDRDLPEYGPKTKQTAEMVKAQQERVVAHAKKLSAILEKKLTAQAPTPTPTPTKPPMATARRNKALFNILTVKLLPKLIRYEQQLATLGNERNSYSKTDPDATFTRTKDGRILPAYTPMIGTQNQFIVNFSIHQKPSDVSAFIPHMQELARMMAEAKLQAADGKVLPGAVIADSAFGSQENYEYLETMGIDPYVKYGMFHPEQTKKHLDNPYRRDAFVFEEESNQYRCPEGRVLPFVETQQAVNTSGFLQELQVYQSADCSGCPGQSTCVKHGTNRMFTVNRSLEAHKTRARELLNSDEGRKLRKRRSIEPESVFGDIKHNQAFRRFLLRGVEKVTVEFGLLAIAHNIRKIWMSKR